MINLIPPQAKRDVIREYWCRALTVLLVLMSLAMAVVVLLHVPTYVLLKSLERSYASEAHTTNEMQARKETLSQEIDVINAKARYITTTAAAVSFTDLRQRFYTFAGETIMIERIDFQADDLEAESQATLYGVAATRSDLASFRDTLVAEPDVATIELPLSSLAADRDLDFQLLLTITSETESETE